MGVKEELKPQFLEIQVQIVNPMERQQRETGTREKHVSERKFRMESYLLLYS